MWTIDIRFKDGTTRHVNAGDVALKRDRLDYKEYLKLTSLALSDTDEVVITRRYTTPIPIKEKS